MAQTTSQRLKSSSTPIHMLYGWSLGDVIARQKYNRGETTYAFCNALLTIRMVV